MLCFPMIRVSGKSKSRLVKAAGAESCGQRRNQKIARSCGEKHILKSKCTKHAAVARRCEKYILKSKC